MNSKQPDYEDLERQLEESRRIIEQLRAENQRLKKSEESLRETELLVQSINNNLSQGMVYQVSRKSDGSRQFTYLSDKVKDFYGITPQQGQADANLIYSRIHEEDRVRVFQEEESANETMSIFSTEVRMLKPQGGVRWSYFISHPRKADDGSTFWDGIEFDITDRKQVEESLLASKELARTIMNIPDGMFILMDADHTILDANAVLSERTGKSLDSLIGTSVWDLMPAPVAKRRKAYQDQVLASGNPVRYQDERQGNWTDNTVYPLFDEHGKVTRVAVYSHDITELKRAEEELNKYKEHLEKLVEERTRDLIQSENRFKHLADNLPDILMRWVPDVGLVYVNPAMERILGFRNDRILKAWGSFMAHVHPEDVSLITDAFQRIATDKHSTQVVEYRVIAHDGRTVWLEAIWTPIWEQGQLTAVDAIARDVTDRKIADDEKEMLKAQLIQSQKMEAIGQLAGGIAHDFNNILATISGTAEMLVRTTPPDAPIIKKLERIQNCSRRAKDLTMKLLTFARKEKLNVKIIPADDIVTDVLDMLNSTASAKIAITSESDDQGKWIHADSNQIFHALLNICLNACDAMPQGGSLHLSLRRVPVTDAVAFKHNITSGEFVAICIEDTGTGIDEDKVDKIFEPFFTTKDRGKGSGLGLSVCHGIIKTHGGFIDVMTQKGKGTAFQVFLPVADPAAMTPGKQEEKRIAKTGQGRILLVDDDREFILMLKEALESEGFVIATALSGKEAVNYYKNRAHEIDIILLDMILPGMHGRDVYYALRELNPQARIVLCSGYSIDGDASSLLENGALSYVQKPFEITEVIDIITGILQETSRINR